ncbi:MAG: type II secretion system F family protein [Candidatus Rhabdochlamydia sp.]
MPLFHFRALQETGKQLQGVIEAGSLHQAKEKLYHEQKVITYLKEYHPACSTQKLQGKDLLHLLKMISQLYDAAVPLYEAMLLVEERYQKRSFHPLLLKICEAVRQGEKLSAAFSYFPQSFTPVMRAILESGEESGNLKASFTQMITLLEEQQRMKKQLIAVLTYPLFLTAFCLVLLIFLLTWMIPSLKYLMEGKQLHPLTEVMFMLSDTFLRFSLPLVIGVIVIIGGCLFCFKHPKFKLIRDEWCLKIPLLGALLRLSITVRVCKTAHFLLGGGVPLVSALTLIQPVLGNQFLEEKLLQTISQITEGKRLSAHLEWMPPLVSKMIFIGEKTGKVSLMFEQISSLCEEEMKEKMVHLLALIQPLLLLALGVMIGIVVLSVLIPLTDIGAVLQS